MKNMRKNKKQMVVIATCIFVLLIGVGVFLHSNKTTIVHAATAPYSDPYSSSRKIFSVFRTKRLRELL